MIKYKSQMHGHCFLEDKELFLADDVNKVFAKVSKNISRVKMEKVCY